MRELLNLFNPNVQWEGAAQWVFFQVIFDFIDDEIKTFQVKVLDGLLLWVSGIALTLVTLWLLWQGYQVMQGKVRNAMELVADSTRVAFNRAVQYLATRSNTCTTAQRHNGTTAQRHNGTTAQLPSTSFDRRERFRWLRRSISERPPTQCRRVRCAMTAGRAWSTKKHARPSS